MLLHPLIDQTLERRELVLFQLKVGNRDDLRHLLPVPGAQTRIANRVDHGKHILELLQLLRRGLRDGQRLRHELAAALS